MKTVFVGPIYPIKYRPLQVQDPCASAGTRSGGRTNKLQEMSDRTDTYPSDAPGGSPTP